MGWEGLGSIALVYAISYLPSQARLVNSRLLGLAPMILTGTGLSGPIAQAGVSPLIPLAFLLTNVP